MTRPSPVSPPSGIRSYQHGSPSLFSPWTKPNLTHKPARRVSRARRWRTHAGTCSEDSRWGARHARPKNRMQIANTGT